MVRSDPSCSPCVTTERTSLVSLALFFLVCGFGVVGAAEFHHSFRHPDSHDQLLICLGTSPTATTAFTFIAAVSMATSRREPP